MTSLTIGISSYQRRGPLARSLAAIAAAVPASGIDASSLDVLVVLDGSDDGSAELVAEAARSFPVALRSHWKPNGGLSSARNACIEHAAGEVVWLLDDDMLVTAEALRSHAGHAREDGGAPVLMGPCRIDPTDDPVVAPVQAWYDRRFGRLAGAGCVRRPVDYSAANTSAPRTLWCRFPFDESFVGYGLEDYEQALRLLDDGVPIAYRCDAAVTHEFRDSRLERRRKLRQEGRNRVVFARLHPGHRHLAFGEPTRIERLLLPLAVAPLSPVFVAVSAALQGISGLLHGRPRASAAVWSYAMELATVSGVAAAGGRREATAPGPAPRRHQPSGTAPPR